MEDKGDSVYRCTYRPTLPGPHTVSVTFGGVGVPRSPFTVDVGPGEETVSLCVETSAVVRLMSDGSVCLLQPARRAPAEPRGGACSRQA